MDSKVDKARPIAAKVYDIVYELNVICPSILLAVMPQLECKLKSTQETERLSKYFSTLVSGLFSNIFKTNCRSSSSFIAHVFGK